MTSSEGRVVGTGASLSVMSLSHVEKSPSVGAASEIRFYLLRVQHRRECRVNLFTNRLHNPARGFRFLEWKRTYA